MTSTRAPCLRTIPTQKLSRRSARSVERGRRYYPCSPAVNNRSRPAIDRTPISSPSGILLSVHLNDELAVLTHCASTMLEGTNGENDENKRRKYTKEDVKLLRAHSKARTPVARVSKLMKRSEGSLRQKARVLGIGLSAKNSLSSPEDTTWPRRSITS